MTDVVATLAMAQRDVLLIGALPFTAPEAWQAVRKGLLDRIEHSDIRCRVIAESDDQLFQHSLRSDTSYGAPLAVRTTYKELRFRSEMLRKELCTTEGRRSRSSFEMSTIPLPIFIARIDNEVWYMPALGTGVSATRFRRLQSDDLWYEMIVDYMERLADPLRDGRYVASPQAELLQLFDPDATPRGFFPRDCFYNTDHHQYVVWDFVFSRSGDLLIHKRSDNAKDNQGMWDKSVGGHVEFAKERLSSDTAIRELIEELYTNEKREQTGHEFSLLSEDTSKVHFLGDWRPVDMGADYMNSITLLERGVDHGEEPWVFFKVPGRIVRETPRILPTGVSRRLRVIVDAYIFIANTLLTREYLKSFSNSQFLLISPPTLKTWIEASTNDRGESFQATPDLHHVMSSSLRNTLDEVSLLIKYANFRR